MNKTVAPIFIFAWAWLVWFAPPAAAEKIKIFVTIEPQAYFAERVGGDLVDVQVLVAPGRSPHDYAPTPQQMAALSVAKIYFQIGVPIEEPLIERLRDVAGNLKFVDTRQGIKLLSMAHAEHADESDAPHHEHGNLDPHIWMSPRLVKLQARTMFLALSEIDPAHRDAYEKNFRSFVADLNALDDEILFALQPLTNRKFMVFHPAFAYFAADYQLTEVAVEVEGKEPSAKQRAQIEDLARAEGIKTIFVQPQMSRKSAEAIAQTLGARVEVLDDLARDYPANLRRIAARILESKP
jgi:zinc transport system substrate-binding protein